MKAVNDNKWFDKVRVNSWEIEILIVACILAFLLKLQIPSSTSLFIFIGRRFLLDII